MTVAVSGVNAARALFLDHPAAFPDRPGGRRRPGLHQLDRHDGRLRRPHHHRLAARPTPARSRPGRWRWAGSCSRRAAWRGRSSLRSGVRSACRVTVAAGAPLASEVAAWVSVGVRRSSRGRRRRRRSSASSTSSACRCAGAGHAVRPPACAHAMSPQAQPRVWVGRPHGGAVRPPCQRRRSRRRSSTTTRTTSRSCT